MKKVFGVGNHKTATSSLDQALRILGYRTTHWDRHQLFAQALLSGKVTDLELAMRDIDAASDLPIPLMIPELDQHYPGSKFILTVRDPEHFAASAENHIGTRRLALEEYLFYGVWKFERKRFLERYRQHNQSVQEYFASRPADLLVLDITTGEGWPKLCGFLGLDVPAVVFPHAYKAKYRPR